jgi:glutamate-ammonia-ligase adenylyltransferase
MTRPPMAADRIYSRLATRLGTWLSAQTSRRPPVRNRPAAAAQRRQRAGGGDSLEAFRQYQLEAAWVWEHQALTRARFCAGDAAVGAKFEQIRIEVLRRPARQAVKLREEVLDMRQRMMDAHGTPAGDDRAHGVRPEAGPGRTDRRGVHRPVPGAGPRPCPPGTLRQPG